MEGQARVAIDRWSEGLLGNLVSLILHLLLEVTEGLECSSDSKDALILLWDLCIRELSADDGQAEVLLNDLVRHLALVSRLEVCKARSVPMLYAGGDRSILLVPDHCLSELVFDAEVWWIVDVLDFKYHALDGSLDDPGDVLVLGC